MRGAAVAAGLLLTCLAFALAFLPRRTALAGSAAAGLGALGAVLINPELPVDLAFAGCWLSLVVAALSVYWPAAARRSPALSLAFAANAGIWAGLVLATEGGLAHLPPVLATLLLGIAARLMIARQWTIAVRVVTSWLLAVAMLVGVIPHLVVHPGYEPDHRI